MIKNVFVCILAIVLAFLMIASAQSAFGQSRTQFNVDDLKRMIADRDITIELLTGELKALQQENAELKAKLTPKPEVKP